MSVLRSVMLNQAASGSGGGWQRPSDWPDFPADAQQEVHIIAMVTDAAANFAALSATVTGGFSVDWGDGSAVDNVASGGTAEHNYSYSSGSLGVATTEGFKCAVIRVYPQTPGNQITVFNAGVKHSQAGLANGNNPWLDMRINLPNVTTLTLRATTAEARFLRRLQIVAIGAVTTLSSFCQSMASLEEFPSWPAGSLASVTTIANCYSGCSSLVDPPAWPSGSLASCTTVSSCYANCTSLLNAPAWPSGSLASCTTVASCYTGCVSLLTAPAWPSGSLASCTTVASCYSGCAALFVAPAWPTGAFSGGSVTTTSVVTGCVSLARWPGCILPSSFTLVGRFGATELDEIYTALPTVVGQTITVTGNYGTASHTPTIATAKGWTVTV